MRLRMWRSGASAVLTAAVLAVAGCAGSADPPGRSVVAEEPDPVPSAVGPAETAPTETGQPTPSASTASPRPGRPASARPKPTASRKPRLKPSKKPVSDKPPAPVKPRPKPGCTEKFVGKAATRAQVKAALTAAADRTYWPVSAPALTVSRDLVKAVAWQESTWRSNVHSCDGGVGLMQVMPGTADQVNQRFEKAYDIDVYTDNAVLGANYLAWLTKYFGDAYFDGDYDLDPGDCTSTTDLCALNMVISAYNYGPGAVDNAADNNRPLPNPGYVKSVRKLMTSCECLAF